MKAKISEIFYSVQGEGIYQFEPQVFVRFWDCNLDCSFCDTKPVSFKELSSKEILDKILSFTEVWESVVFTGGEPLCQHKLLREIASLIKEEHKKTYLETNGVLVENLQEVIDLIDVIAMDFKLPSSTGFKPFWSKHRQFLKVAYGKKVFVKAVVTLSTEKQDLIQSAKIIREVDQKIPFVLQPCFGYEVVLGPKLEEFKQEITEIIEDVQIIPQLHKHIGVR